MGRSDDSSAEDREETLLDLPELEEAEDTPPPFKKPEDNSFGVPRKVVVGEVPHTPELPPEIRKDLPDMSFKMPPPQVVPNRSKLDAWGMVFLAVVLILAGTSPFVLGVLETKPPRELNVPGVKLKLNISPKPTALTEIEIDGYRVDYVDEPVVDVPYGAPHFLQIKSRGFHPYGVEVKFSPPAKKDPAVKEDLREQAFELVPLKYGLLSLRTDPECMVDISDGMNHWRKRTPLRLFKVSEGDLVIKTDDPKCPDKIFTLQLKESAEAIIIWETRPEERK